MLSAVSRVHSIHPNYFYPLQLNFPVEKHLMVTSHDSRHVGTHTHSSHWGESSVQTNV